MAGTDDDGRGGGTADLQREARALGDPTRFRLFHYIADSRDPVGVAELTAYVGLNHNAVRQHLAVLKGARLVVEEVEERRRPGRPALLYRVHPEATGAWGTAGPYAWLAGLLAQALEHGWSPREAGRREGQRRAEQDTDVSDSLDALEGELEHRGFRPDRRARGARTDFVLERCAFVEVAATHAATVCQVHLGLAEGFAERRGDLTIERLRVRDPHAAGCSLVVAPAPTPTRRPGSRVRTRRGVEQA